MKSRTDHTREGGSLSYKKVTSEHDGLNHGVVNENLTTATRNNMKITALLDEIQILKERQRERERGEEVAG